MTAVSSTQLLVVGGGAAGLSAALAAVESGLDVVVADAHDFDGSASVQAQGGFAAVTAQGLAAGDSVAAHVADTLAAGAGHGDPAVVRAICAAAGAHADTLERWGTAWDRNRGAGGARGYALTREAAHSADRILHCGGDATGAGIVAALRSRARDVAAGRIPVPGRLTVLDRTRVTRLLMDAGSVVGAVLRPAGEGAAAAVAGIGPAAGAIGADAVLLASGGISGVYATRTSRWPNSAGALALAWDAGAVFADAEMVQFHPTYVPDAGFMVSEALRGEGAVLRDAAGARFMAALDPAAELAPRDVVARGVARATELTGGAWLDAAPIVAREGAGFLARRFPTITAALADSGLDLEHEPVRVTPAQHYWMGGVAVDRHARSTVPGLLVAGEAARTGLHGANRLASNSLLEAVHTGIAAARSVATGLSREPGEPLLPGAAELLCPELASPAPGRSAPGDTAAVRRIADARLGVARDARGLTTALADLARLAGPEALTAGLVAASARARADSLGAHLRTDAPSGTRPRPDRTITVVNPRPGAISADTTALGGLQAVS